MLTTLRLLTQMRGLQLLVPFFVLGLILMLVFWHWWMPIALAYGIVMQFVVEYVLHRFVYHREPPAEQSAFNSLYATHIAHHEAPSDPRFLTGDDHWYAVRFGTVSWLIHSAVLCPLVGLVPALAGAATAIFVGSIAAFTFYEYCHTLAHLNIKKGWFGRAVTRSHLAHHFQDHQATFHVSFGQGWIDQLLGTGFDRARAKQRFEPDSVHCLGMNPRDLRLVLARRHVGLDEAQLKWLNRKSTP